jgi:hypothetical protein
MTAEIIPVGGKPKANIKREKYEDKDKEAAAKEFLTRSGKSLTPSDLKYMGSAVVHFYQHEKQSLFAFVAHVTGGIEHLPEPQASAGWKELGRAMMDRFGRKPPEHRGGGPSESLQRPW